MSSLGSDHEVRGFSNFSPMLLQDQFPLNEVVKALLRSAENAAKAKVEIEFAVTLQGGFLEPLQARLGFLQVRPMVVSDQLVEVTAEDLSNTRAIVSSEMVMGNGIADDIQDVVFVRPERFSPADTPAIALQLELINQQLQAQHRPYLLIGFGRWGSSHPSLGIPVDWSQISGARAMVEATLPEMNVELSQGSHFFHNLSSFGASYFMVRHGVIMASIGTWLNRQPVVTETELRSPRAAGEEAGWYASMDGPAEGLSCRQGMNPTSKSDELNSGPCSTLCKSGPKS